MKSLYMLGATIGMFAGAYVPMLFGDKSLLDGWGILGSTIGGIVGIWAVAAIAKRF